MAISRKLTDDEQAALDAIGDRPDSEIDLTDIPEVTNWAGAVRGMFRPVKRHVTIRLDADLLAWFEHQGKGYQTRINAALREYVDRHKGA
ncbi:MAG: BrnA antitoxin family protein [Azospirillaceae bacterium]|nr:BrnA antitoxin family protein [Azospirillaceae bacterium]